MNSKPKGTTKAISPVISVILLLLIAIGLVYTASTWISSSIWRNNSKRPVEVFFRRACNK